MSWLTWRQYRLQAIAVATLLAAFGAVLLVTGLQMAQQWSGVLATCQATVAGCGNQPRPALDSGLATDLTGLATVVPAILGILWGAPLAGAEIESGTVTFAWTQGVTRTRWLAVKAGWLLLAAAVVGGAVSGLLTWWSGPRNAATADALWANVFDTQGVVSVGYAVFAVALGIAAGTLLRRTLPAVAVTLAGFIGVRLVIAQFLRTHLIPATVAYSPVLSGTWPTPQGPSLILSTGMADKFGQPIPEVYSREIAGVPVSYLSAACRKLAAPFTYNGNPGDITPTGHPTAATQKLIDSCVRASGVRNYVSYQPASHYWPLQFAETGIFAVLAIALVAVAFAVLRYRDA
jgi:hypothetical protein